MAIPVEIGSRAALSALVSVRGMEEGVPVVIADELPRIADLIRLRNRLLDKIDNLHWDVDGFLLLDPLVPIARLLGEAVSELHALLRATVPNHLRFNMIEEEAEKLSNTANAILLELATLEEGHHSFVLYQQPPHLLVNMAHALNHLSQILLHPPAPTLWSLLHLQIRDTKRDLDEIYERRPVLLGVAPESDSEE